MGFAPQREPDVGGRVARAWLCRCTPAERAQWPASLDTWLVVVNGDVIGWSVFVVALIVLRDVPGVPPAHLSVEGATHELMVWAIDDQGRTVDPDEADSYGRAKRLDPPNYGRQFAVESDLQATQVAKAMVVAFCSGALPVEPDVAIRRPDGSFQLKTIAVGGRSMRSIVHGSIDATARCVREGNHASN